MNKEKIVAVDLVTVRDLIHKLLEERLDDEVLVRTAEGKRLHKVVIYTKKQPEGLGCLFG